MNNNTYTYKFDYVLKKYTSYAYRIFIVIIAMVIIFTQNNFFNLDIYMLISMLYIIYLFHSNKFNGIYRLLIDYGYIVLILFDKELYVFLNIILILFPLINSPNHTSKHKKLTLLFVVSSLSFCILYLTNSNYKNDISIMTIISALIGLALSSMLIYFEYMRNLFIKDIIQAYKKIDSIDFDNSRASNIPNIYKNIINIMNDELLNKYSVGSKINSITCISLTGQAINIENSSAFVLDIKLDNASIQKLYNLNANDSILFNVQFEVDNNKKHYNIVVCIEYKKKKFFFILFLTKYFKEPNFILKIVINDYLYSLFKKILITINFEEHINRTKLNNTRKILSEMKYVSTTNKSLHTLNNQFTPIKTYFTMLNDYEDVKFDLDKKVLEVMLKKQRIQAENSFNRIVQLSDYLLNKNLNPFSVKKLEDIKLKVLYMTLKPIWIEEFSIKEIIFDLNGKKLEEIVVYSNLSLIEILFIDIIQNIKKHAKSERSVSFEYKDGIISIIFRNNIKSPKEKRSLLKDIKLFNDDDKTQLLLKKGHGFSNIKEIITNLSIFCEMNIKNEIFEIKINIKEKEKKHENFSI